MYFLHSVRTKTRLVHLKISFWFYFFVWGLVQWLRLSSLFLSYFIFLRILVYGGHCPLIFIFKKNKQINMHWIFCMAFLVVDHFGELHFWHWCTSFSWVNIYYLFSHFFSFYLHHHHFLFYSCWLWWSSRWSFGCDFWFLSLLPFYSFLMILVLGRLYSLLVFLAFPCPNLSSL